MTDSTHNDSSWLRSSDRVQRRRARSLLSDRSASELVRPAPHRLSIDTLAELAPPGATVYAKASGVAYVVVEYLRQIGRVKMRCPTLRFTTAFTLQEFLDDFDLTRFDGGGGVAQESPDSTPSRSVADAQPRHTKAASPPAVSSRTEEDLAE